MAHRRPSHDHTHTHTHMQPLHHEYGDALHHRHRHQHQNQHQHTYGHSTGGSSLSSAQGLSMVDMFDTHEELLRQENGVRSQCCDPDHEPRNADFYCLDCEPEYRFNCRACDEDEHASCDTHTHQRTPPSFRCETNSCKYNAAIFPRFPAVSNHIVCCMG